ncbi:MAG: TadE family protein [Candidatus Cybelea sp.]
MIKKLFRSQAGTAMIEFALLTPAFALLFMGIVEFGRYGTYAILAQGAALAGANYGSANLITAADINGMESWATNDAQYLPAPITVNAKHLCSVNGSLPPTGCVFGAAAPVNTVYYVQVTVSANYTPWIAYPGIPGTITVSGSNYLRVAMQ